jgi:hypothetical protein
MDELKKRVDTLDGKHSYFEICHTELAQRNIKIKKQMNGLLEQEKQLENLLIVALKHLMPGKIIKNSDLKYFENVLPDSVDFPTNNFGASQLMECGKTSYQKNDILNTIYKEIRNLFNYYNYVKNTEPNDNIESHLKGYINSNISNSLTSAIPQSNKLKDSRFQDFNMEVPEFTFRHNYEDHYPNINNIGNSNLSQNNLTISSSFFQNTNNINTNVNINSNITKIYPRRTGSVHIIENNVDYDMKPELRNPPFEVLSQSGESKNHVFLKNKRVRSPIIVCENDFDKIHADSNYKIENKD